MQVMRKELIFKGKFSAYQATAYISNFFVAQVAHVELPSQEKLGQELLCFAVDNHARDHTSHHSKDHQHAMIINMQ